MLAAISWGAGGLSVAAIHYLASRFAAAYPGGAAADGRKAARIAGIVAAAVLVLSQAFADAVTVAGEPAWRLAAVLAGLWLAAAALGRRGGRWLWPVVVMALGALGLWESAPGEEGWMYPALLVALPVALLAAVAGRDSPRMRMVHADLTVLVAIGLCSPLSPYDVTGPRGVVPVYLTATAALGTGYLAAWWWRRRTAAGRVVLATVAVWFAVATAMRPPVLGELEARIEGDMARGAAAVAERDARAALAIDGGCSVAWYVLGSLALARGETDEAERGFRKAVAAENPYAAAYNDLAEMLRRQGRYAEARPFAMAATERCGDRWESWDTLAAVLMAAEDGLAAAEAAAAKAVAAARKGGRGEAAAMTTLAKVQLKRGEREAARRTVNAILPLAVKMTPAERKELEGVYRDVR